MLDTVIRNSTLFGLDGDDSAITDLGIKDGVIHKIGKIENEAARVIDGTGYYTMPGFIDAHSHSDYYLLIDPTARSKIHQGVTTEICGNCGYSAAPIGGDLFSARRESYKEQFGLDLDWQDFSQYLHRLAQRGSAVNFVGLVGYNTLRGSILGMKDIPMDARKKEEIKQAVRENLSHGAAGMSVGFVYPPACFASRDELAEIVTEVQKQGKTFTTHIRSEGPMLVESIKEVLEIADRTGVKLLVSHLKTAGKENWHKLDTVFEMLESARARGVDVECDRYPYLASNTGLQVVLPDWVFDGGRDAILERLADRNMRDKIIGEILKNHPDAEYWDTVMVSQVVTKKNQSLQGLTVSEGARARGMDVFNFVFDLLIEEKTDVEAIYFCMNQTNMDRVLTKNYVMVGSDAGARSISGPLGIGRPHPRTFGTFPRFFREYVFDRKLISMRDAVRKTSFMASQRFGLKKRGRLAEGYHADIVMIDAGRIKDNSTYSSPLAYPDGVDYVWVNGVLSIDRGNYTNALAGEGLKVN